MIIMGSRHLTSPSPACTACGSTSRGQVCHTEASWKCTPFTGDTRRAAFQAIEDSKALHARRWQTKEGMYRIKRRALPDVRDAPLQDDNAAASCSDGKPRWRCWDGDYAMGYQHHPGAMNDGPLGVTGVPP